MNVEEVCRKAKDNASAIAFMSESDMNKVLSAAADALINNRSEILTANGEDVKNAEAAGKDAGFIDRLTLTESRIEGIVEGLRELCALKCPIGEVMDDYVSKDGLRIRKVRVPMGVVCFIYEARPNVTADAIGLCVKSGNAVVLRGSKDALESNRTIVKVIKKAISALGFNPEFIQLVEDVSREAAVELMKQKNYVDVLIPRGSAGLINSALENSKIPVIETGTGNCHVYVHEGADTDKALKILMNAKTQRISVCNCCESLLVDEKIADRFLPMALEALHKAGVEIRGCEKSAKYADYVLAATEDDYYREFLAMPISVKVVSGLDEAVSHINKYGTHHSDAIITEDRAAGEKFLEQVDSAAVYVNASTRFTDGFVFGLGAELGISTQKLHARGPMGLKEITSYKYQILGDGQIRK